MPLNLRCCFTLFKAQLSFLFSIFLCLLQATVVQAGLDPYGVVRTLPNCACYSDISGGSPVTSWRNGSSTDDNLSNALPIGFNFEFDGGIHTQFLVSLNGFITFNIATKADGGNFPGCSSNSVEPYAGDNTRFSTAGKAGTLSAIAPFYDDLEKNTSNSLNTIVHYQLSGVAPNRVLTVQWRSLSKAVNSNCDPCTYGSYTFQVKLYETSGNIEFIYGTMSTGFDELSKNYSCGLNSSTLTSTPNTSQLFVQTTANTQTFGSTVSNTLSAVPASNSSILFTRTPPAPPAGVPTSVTYNFPADGATNQCVNSILSWSNGDGVPTGYDVYFDAFNPPTTLVQSNGSTYYNPGNLVDNTTYYWQVIPRNGIGEASPHPAVRSFTTGPANTVTSISSSLGNTICTGQTTVLTVNGSLAEGSEYNWTTPIFFFSCEEGTPADVPFISPIFGNCNASSRNYSSNSAGSQTIDVFARGCNGTTSCARITITRVASATAPTTIAPSTTTTVCAGTPITLTVSGGTHAGGSYVWYTEDCGVGTPIANSGATSATTHAITVTPTENTTYYVRREGQCPAATTCASISIIVESATVGDNTITGDQVICFGQTPGGIDGSSPTGGSFYTFFWESSETSASSGFGPALGNNSLQSYAPGSLIATTWYRRIVTAGGCSEPDTSNVVEVTVGGESCDDGSPCTIDLCENGNCTHFCTLDITNLIPLSNTIEGCADGSISAVIDTGSCSGSWEVFLYEGLAVTRSWSSAQGNSLLWDDLPSGNYVMVATDLGGCADSDSIFIGVAQQPCRIDVENPGSNPVSVDGCDDGSINAIVNAFVCEGSWSATLFDALDNSVGNWQPIQGTALLWNNLPQGNYRIHATDGGTCATDTTISIEAGEPCHVMVQNVQKTVVDCDSNTITADISNLVCGNTWFAYLYDEEYINFIATWTHEQGGNIVWENVPLGNYHIVATHDFLLCSDTADISLFCSDEDPCTNDDCEGGCSFSIKCDDNNLCTFDFCQPDGQCVFQELICNDNNACTFDACVDGSCVHTPRNCADNNPCTEDQCISGNCTHSPLICNDVNACTNDFCSQGNCVFQPICLLNDNNPCTDDFCVNRTCIHVQKNCDDANACTSDLCQGGVCVNTLLCVLDDGDDCTLDQCLGGVCANIDTCVIGECVNTPGICNDNNLCTRDTCISGGCVNIPADCDDDNACTVDACEVGTGNCVHTQTCILDDGDPCTNDFCVFGDCIHLPVNCNDNNECSSDYCQNGNCIFEAICELDDSDPCTNDYCLNGLCIHDEIICNDGELCTLDDCIGGACVFEPIVCEDGNSCTIDSCFNGNCEAAPIPGCENPCDALVCNDGDPCTVDSCSNGTCDFSPLNCDDDDVCTEDACDAGECNHTILSNCNLEISGMIMTETNIPVPTVTLKLTGSGNQTFTTAQDGNYKFDVVLGDNCTVTPSKSNDSITNNGISTLDLILIQRHILNIQPFNSPYKIIAADVNNSQTVSTLDIIFIRTVILQVSQSFPNGRLWAFANSDFIFTDPAIPFPYDNFRSYSGIASDQNGQDFIGIKLGDVNNSWNPNIPKMQPAGAVWLSMDEYSAATGEEVSVPVMAGDFNAIAGYQFTLSWDARVLSLLQIVNQSVNGYYGEHKAHEGRLTTSWHPETGDVVTLPDDAILFELKFNVTGEEGSISRITIGSELVVSEAYSENLEALTIASSDGVVKVGNATSVADPASDACHLFVQPNPFSNTTGIVFNIPVDANISIVIYDLFGKKVKQLNGAFRAGRNQLEWDGSDAAGQPLANGLYHIRMIAGGEVRGAKALLVK